MSYDDWKCDNDPTRDELEAQVGALENERDSWKDQVEDLRAGRDRAIERITELEQIQNESARIAVGYAHTMAQVQAEAYARAADIVRRMVK